MKKRFAALLVLALVGTLFAGVQPVLAEEPDPLPKMIVTPAMEPQY